MQIIKKHKEKIFNWLLIMTGVSISFPDYSLVSKLLIGLFGFWLFFYSSIDEKKMILKENKSSFLWFSSLFFLFLFGISYTDNFSAIPQEFVLKIMLFIIPLIIFSTKINKEIFEIIYKYFSYAVVINSLSAITKIYLFKFLNIGNYTFYHNISIFIEKHTTYYALLIVLAILYFVWRLLEKSNGYIISIISVFILIFTMYITSNRISILALSFGTIILIFGKLSAKKSIIFSMIILALLAFFFSTPNFKNRFNPDYLKVNKTNEINLRKALWTSVLKTAKHNNILIGKGSESKRDYLYNQYLKNGYKIAYIERYNAHNQYFEYLLDYGLFGVVILFGLLVYLLNLFWRNKDFIALVITFVFIIFMLTESILERQTGIITFTFFITLLMRLNQKKKTN